MEIRSRHQLRLRVGTTVALALSWSACGSDAASRTALDAEGSAAIRALIDAGPGEWAERIPPVLQLGQEGARPLIEAALATPESAGAAAAVATAARMGDCGIRTDLEGAIRHSALADEAVLGLGHLPAPESRATLLHLARDGKTASTTRAAAAASLLRLGFGKEIAPLLEALLLAATPAGQSLAAEQGLDPAKTRWALERHMLLDAMRDRAGQHFGIDTDASWTDLEAGTRRFLAWLRREP